MKLLLTAVLTLAVMGSSVLTTTAHAQQDQQLRGRIQAIQGSTIVVTTSDGRLVNVNLANINAGVRNEMQVDQNVTVIGSLRGNWMTAESILVASARAESDTLGSALPRAVASDGGPTGPADCKNGGWKEFTNPTFKDQDDCMAFLTRY